MEMNLFYSDQDMDLMKLSMLYFDKVNILNHKVGTTNASISFKTKKLDNLVKNNLLAFKDVEANYSLISDDEKTFVINILSDYLEKPYEYFLLEDGRPTLYAMLRGHYIHIIYDLILHKQNFISNDGLMDTAIRLIYQKINKTAKNFIAINAIPIFLPNFYQMEIDDILNLHYFAKDELQEMKYYINGLSSEFSPDDIELENIKLFLKSKINPAIKNFESKIYSIRVGAIQRALEGLKDPLTYTPMLTTFFADIPTHISLAISMGLITAEAGLEYLKQKKEIETDPLYFSVKLKKNNNKII